jgi:hypothetical protein
MKASRGASIPAAYSALVLSCAACQPQIEIVLVKDADLVSAPPFVKFQVKERGAQDVAEFGPFDISAIPSEQFAPVVPGTEFFIDVIGCGDGDPALCVESNSFNARGCTDFMTLAKAEVRSIEITLHNAAAGDLLCPPPG